ncbi:MAG: aminoacyl-histidine dipeptidase [Firmicutes bacterium]|nr:aminoacyl-histidine dipeptidase [Bacillota bacterium]
MPSLNREPKKVLGFFERISKIPRGSGNEKAISDYLVKFGEKRGLVVKQDENWNVIIFKPGCFGLEQNPPVVLQSHVDMVCEKNADTEFNFLTDSLSLEVDGDFLYAKGTTLGADNGVGVALSMAILDSDDIPHPPLEVLFTVEEETTMKGISTFDETLLKGRRMINMDSGSDSAFCVGCAGGGRFFFKVSTESEPLPANTTCKRITVRGLLGGHSGIEIHLGKANSNRLLARILDALLDLDIRIITMSGGLKANAIPREAEAEIAIPTANLAQAEQIISDLQKDMRIEYRLPDPNITLAFLDISHTPTEVFTKECTQKLVSTVMLLPLGVLHMSQDIPGLVEVSNNVGVMRTDENAVVIDCALRSSVPSRYIFVSKQIMALGKALGAEVKFIHQYPGWVYNPKSQLLATATEVYREIYKKTPQIEAVHAGLECGFMMEKIPDMDIISYCCQIVDAHTPNEHLSIPSLDRVWKFTIALLKTI